MKVALIGATGYVGAPILAELLSRAHEVTAIVRNPARLPAAAGFRPVALDIHDPAALAATLAGHDAVISAYNPGLPDGESGTRSILEATRTAGIGRVIAVGGAGSLRAARGERLLDAPDFPPAWKAGALATAAFLEMLRGQSDLDWAFVCPAARLVRGERTCRFRIGGDQLLTDSRGESVISLADYAVALVDELERPRHHRQRFTVAY